MNNFAIHIKFHLKNPGLNFQKSIQMFQTIPSNPKSLITPFLLQHGKLVSYTIKYSTTLIHCHLILLYLHSITGLKYNFYCVNVEGQQSIDHQRTYQPTKHNQ